MWRRAASCDFVDASVFQQSTGSLAYTLEIGHQTRTLNYFNYFTEIEDAFVRRRGKHLHLSPMDWALIESWKALGVPLHIALRGIERSFDSWESKPRKRSVKTLLYCQEEVEAQFAEWLEARVGANESGDSGGQEAVDDSNPFSRADILAHLQGARGQLDEALEKRKTSAEDVFCESLTRASSLLRELEVESASVARPDARKLEDSLTGIERMLSEAVRLAATDEQTEAVRKEIIKQLRPYRSHMEREVYERTFDNLLLKRLREQLGVPRLSLFYL